MIKKMQISERKQKKRELQQQLSLILMVLTVFLAMVVPLLSTHSSGSGLKDLGLRYTEGELSSEDIFATSSFQYVDDEQTQKLIEQRMQEVLPHFSYSLRSSTITSRRLENFLALFHQGNLDSRTFLEKEGINDERNVVERIAGLDPEQQQLLLQALEETGSYILERGLFDEEEVNTVRSQGYGELLVRNSLFQQESSEPSKQTIDTLLTKKNLPSQLSSLLEPYELIDSQFQPYLVLDALEMLLDPNVDYEAVETLALREEAAAEIPEQVITIERGEKIIAKDTVVTSSQIDLLQLMGSNSFQYTILELIGRAIFILLSTSVSVYVFIQFLHAEKRLYLYLNLMLVSVSLSLVAMYVVSLFFTSRSSLFLDSYLPVLFAPLFTSHITSKKRLGLVSAFLLACYATLMEQSSSITFFFVLTISGVCLYFFRYTIKRIDDVFNWFYACVISSFTALALYMLEALPLHQVMPLGGGMILNITITLGLLEAFVPLSENLFNIPTAYRLGELAFSASPV
ncbi:phosphohydrolase, partial [Sphaerochaeta sp. S2]|uniref:phosphohydrolase n=1 Tax=Sphaerochaeta sp. S2 TaxID=2798868 RepID=UPI0018E9B092